jgi:hypothetical protein
MGFNPCVFASRRKKIFSYPRTFPMLAQACEFCEFFTPDFPSSPAQDYRARPSSGTVSSWMLKPLPSACAHALPMRNGLTLISQNHSTPFPAFEMFPPTATPAGTFSASPGQRNKRCGTHGGNAGIHSTCREVLPTATPVGARSAISSAAKVPDARNRHAPARRPTPPPRA